MPTNRTETKRLHSAIAKETLKRIRHENPQHDRTLWMLLSSRLKKDRGLTGGTLWSATRNAIAQAYRDEDPQHWADVRAQVREDLIAERGWVDERPAANRRRHGYEPSAAGGAGRRASEDSGTGQP